MRIVGGFIGLALVALLWGIGASFVVVILTVALATLGAYLVGALVTAGAIRGAPSVPVVPARPVEMLAEGFMIGLTAGVNVRLWALVPFGVPIGAVLAVICLLVALPPVSKDPRFQTVLGWSSWLMPYSWLATAFGLLLFLVNLPFALRSLGRGAIRLDPGTGTIETTGGIVGITGFVGGGFNLGNFSFLSPRPGQGLDIQTPFDATGLSAHETGHTLAMAAFGGIFHWINAVDENVPPLRRKRAAYGELIAESHFPAPLPRRHVRIWS